MYDITHYFTDQEFRIIGTFTYAGAEDSVDDVVAIISRGQNPGRESGKGLTSAIRAIEANFAIINFDMEFITTEPTVHSKFVNDETEEEWEILSAENVGSGFWRCEAKKSDTVKARGRGRR